jgi:hypothetical protein
VTKYFNLFLECGGCIGTTVRRIHQEGISYPDPAVCHPPEGFKVYYGIQRYGSGYFPSKSGLSALLANAAYVGHWCVNHTVVRWNNHPAIIEAEVFTRAFNYISPYALDGQANLHYRPYRQQARPSLDSDRPFDRPLCAGMIVSQVDGEWRNVGTEWVKREKHYRYLLASRLPYDEYVWSKNADWIDEAVTRLLHSRLRVTFDSDIWEQKINSFKKTVQRDNRLKQAQLTALEHAMANLVASLETLTSPQMIQAAQERYEHAQQEQARLSGDMAAYDDEAEQIATIYALKDKYESVLENWPQMTRNEKWLCCMRLSPTLKQHQSTTMGFLSPFVGAMGIAT